jgi:hypothetical protein
MTASEYFHSPNSQNRPGHAAGDTFRGGLQNLLESLASELSAATDAKSAQADTSGLNLEIVNQIAKGLGLSFDPEPFGSLRAGKEGAQGDRRGEVCFAESNEVMSEYRQTFAPIDLLDYIYAVLHSPTFREWRKEFLKIDFSRIPRPTDADKFWKLVALGGELRQLHLMESPVLNQLITQYPVSGENEVDTIRFKRMEGLPTGRVHINSEQYFESVPEFAWTFYIGGYQPAQKWLEDHKGRTLDLEQITHYQKIIRALVETDRMMKEIDILYS